MAPSDSRIVRIPVRRERPAAPTAPPVGGASDPSRPDEPTPYAANLAGTARALRSFLLFTTATLAIYAAFVSLFATSATPGVRDNAFGYAAFTAFAALLVGVAYGLTLRTAPRGVRRSGDEIEVTERSGRRRRFSSDAGVLRPLVLKRYRPGPLNAETVVLLQVIQPDGERRAYLLDEGLIPTPSRTI